MDRRTVLRALAGSPLLAACRNGPAERQIPAADPESVLGTAPLGAQWPTLDPFLFCVHHEDAYPIGNTALGPAVSLAGRQLGRDFAGKDGFSMYHGEVVPGFPQHPHRGFETVTVVRRGLVDHSDSLEAAARYGAGDVQWLTAGRGISHSEMFPLLSRSAPNPLELFQIWLNLPKADKFAVPHFSMLWKPQVPRITLRDGAHKAVQITVIAGKYGDATGAAPPPNSWAARADSDVAIWTVALAPHADFELPAAHLTTNRMLYFFRGTELRIGANLIAARHAVQLRGDTRVTIRNGPVASELLLLQGRPIGEPTVQQGPFVMNSREEVMQAFADYRATRFGGWPWQSEAPVHGESASRFARHADGRVETPT